MGHFFCFNEKNKFRSLALIVEIRLANMGRKSSNFCEHCAVKCKDCDVKYQSTFCINLHRNKHNITCSKKKKFKCNVCLKKFKNVVNFLVHKTLHDQKKKTKLSSKCAQSCGVQKPKEKVKDEEVQKSSRRKKIPRRLEEKSPTTEITANDGCLGPLEQISKSSRALGKHPCLSAPSHGQKHHFFQETTISNDPSTFKKDL